MGRKSRLKRDRREGHAPPPPLSVTGLAPCRRCGWEHAAVSPCLFEHESGDPKVESFVFGCRGEVYAHGLPAELLDGVDAAKDLLRDLLAKGAGALLPCGTCHAGEVFPLLFERGLCL